MRQLLWTGIANDDVFVINWFALDWGRKGPRDGVVVDKKRNDTHTHTYTPPTIRPSVRPTMVTTTVSSYSTISFLYSFLLPPSIQLCAHLPENIGYAAHKPTPIHIQSVYWDVEGGCGGVWRVGARWGGNQFCIAMAAHPVLEHQHSSHTEIAAASRKLDPLRTNFSAKIFIHNKYMFIFWFYFKIMPKFIYRSSRDSPSFLPLSCQYPSNSLRLPYGLYRRSLRLVSGRNWKSFFVLCWA